MAFRSGNTNLPQGVNLQHTSFGQNQGPYTKPTFPGGPTNTNVQKAKPRGGWDDDDDNDQPTLKGTSGGGFQGNQTTQNTTSNPGSATFKPNDDFSAPKPKKGNPAIDYEIIYCDEKFVASHEFENRTINDRIQPGGARVKQPENLLNEFVTASESFQAQVIGSLLFSKLGEEIPNVSKARTMYLIEAIVKKVKKYYDYFNHNLNTFREIDFGGDAQLTKIQQDIIKYIENPNKPKTIPVTNPTVNTVTTKNLLDDNLDLLGNSPVKGKQDPFAFIQKTPSDTSNHSNQSKPTQQQQSFELLDDFPSQQGYNNPPPQTQTQSQPKKFNPFDIGVNNNPPVQQQSTPFQQQQQSTPFQSTPFQNTQPVNTQSTPFQNVQQSQPNTNTSSTAKPGLNFKKFQAGTGSTTPTSQQNGNNNNVQPSTGGYTLDNLDDLLASDLTISNEPVSKPTTGQNAFPYQNTNQNANGSQSFNKPAEQQTQQNQQFGTQQQQQQSFPQQNQGFNQFNQQGGQQGFGNQPQQFGTQSQTQQQKPNFPQQQNQFPTQQGGFPGYGQGGFQGGYPQQQGGFGGQMYPQQGFQGGYGYYPNQQYGGGGYGQQLPYGQFPGGQNFGGYPNQGGFPGYQQGGQGQNTNGNTNQGQWQQQQGFGKK